MFASSVPSSYVLSLPVVCFFFPPSVIVPIIMWLMCHLCVLLTPNYQLIMLLKMLATVQMQTFIEINIWLKIYW